MLLFQTKKTPSLILKKRSLLRKFGIFPTRVFHNTKIYPLLPNLIYKSSDIEPARIASPTPKPRTESVTETELITWTDPMSTVHNEDRHMIDPVELRTSTAFPDSSKEAQSEMLTRLKELRLQLQNTIRPVNPPEGNTQDIMGPNDIEKISPVMLDQLLASSGGESPMLASGSSPGFELPNVKEVRTPPIIPSTSVPGVTNQEVFGQTASMISPSPPLESKNGASFNRNGCVFNDTDKILDNIDKTE